MICFCRDLFQKFVDMERKVSMLSERQGDPLKVLHKSYCELANLASNERCGEDVRSIGRTQKKSMAIAAQRSGIEFIDPKRGDKFDDRIHICGEYVDVSDLKLDGMVYSCTSPGCRVGERIEEKAVVEVARCCRNISHNNRNSEEDDGMSLYDHTPSVSVSIESSEDTDNSEKSPRRLRPRITESYNVYSGQPLEYGRVPAESDTETKKPVDLLNTGDPREHSI